MIINLLSSISSFKKRTVNGIIQMTIEYPWREKNENTKLNKRLWGRVEYKAEVITVSTARKFIITLYTSNSKIRILLIQLSE
jgi:hypothetical protein